MYHKTRSKRQRSLVESNGDESGPAETISRDSVMKSVDFSTTTESTDSGELLSSAPTTPGDVFTDRATSPLPGAPANIEDLYFPGRDEIHSKFSDSRKKLTEKLMADLDNDDNYFVSPPGSRQPTVEKAATLTEAQEQNLEEEGEKLRHHRVKSQFLDDELPRMSSIQSDSSGFGDAEVSGDNAPQEMAFLKEFDDNQQVQSRVTHKQGSGPSPTDPGSGRRFVSWCYIPVSNRSTQPNSTSPRKQSTRAATSPKDFVLGKTRISLVLQEKDPQQMDSSGRRDVRREGAELDSNERPLSEELALAGLRGELQSSTPRYPAGQVPVTSVPRLMLQRPTMDTGSPDGTRSSGDELDDERSSPYSPWGRDMASGGAGARHRFTPSAGDEGDFGSGASVEESSVYSCASTTDSITSGSSSEILDCHKLIKLINQPTMFKKLQEETRLAQYAVQKFKTELSIMETAVMVKYQMAFEDLSQEEREDVEELQHLWSEVRRQVMETEHLLTSRMKAIASGNDCFNSLASISVLQRMIDILKEQMFQSQISCSQEEREEEEEEEGERWMCARNWEQVYRVSKMTYR
nr:hypothetical protein BaRGS_027735 [Batillaria attramentaria]